MNRPQDRLQHLLSRFEERIPTGSVDSLPSDQDAELDGLVSLAAQLRTMAHPTLSEATKPAMHATLIAAMQREQATQRSTWFDWHSIFSPRLVGAVSFLFIFVVAMWGGVRLGVWEQAITTLRRGEVTPVMGAQHVLTPARAEVEANLNVDFEPQAQALSGCQEDLWLTGTVVNSADQAMRSDLQLDYVVTQGQSYVDALSMEPMRLPELAPGERADFVVNMTMNDAWAAAPAASVVQVHIFATANTPAADTLAASILDSSGSMPSLTLTLSQDCPSSAPGTSTPRTSTPGASTRGAGIEEDLKNDEEDARATQPGEPCAAGAQPIAPAHEVAVKVAMTPEKTMEFYCAGIAFGEIEIAYALSQESGLSIDEIISLRLSGLGWGKIRIQLGTVQPLGPSEERP